MHRGGRRYTPPPSSFQINEPHCCRQERIDSSWKHLQELATHSLLWLSYFTTRPPHPRQEKAQQMRFEASQLHKWWPETSDLPKGGWGGGAATTLISSRRVVALRNAWQGRREGEMLPTGEPTASSAFPFSGVPRTAAEDQAGAAQPLLRAELRLQSGAALQAPVWREGPLQHQVGAPPFLPWRHKKSLVSAFDRWTRLTRQKKEKWEKQDRPEEPALRSERCGIIEK